MKITTWNVNGLRSALKKGAWNWIEANQSDVVLFQEIKTQPGQLDETQKSLFQNWEVVWNPAQRPGYSGVATLMKSHTNESVIGLGHPEFDSEGRLICTFFDEFWLFNIYFPHGRHDLSRVKFKLDFYQKLLDKCNQLHSQGLSIILAGDFNTCHKPIDLKNPKTNEGASGFLPEEREMIDLYLANGFTDIYRQKYPDKIQYTWWAYHSNARMRNTGWRLDYFLISKDLEPEINDVIIHDEVFGSDHCPVTLSINAN